MNGFVEQLLKTKLTFGECHKTLKKLIKKPVIIYGAGTVGQLFINLCYDPDIQLIAVCDKNKKNQPCPVVGVISDFEEIVKSHKDFQVIIASEIYYEEIKKYILKYIKEENIIDAKLVYSNIPICHQLATTSEYRKLIIENKKDIDTIAETLADEKSQKTLKAMILARSTWNLDYFQDVIDEEQYFPQDIIKLKKDEVFIDGGAFEGDTLKKFVEITSGEFKKVYCLEPGDNQFLQLMKQYKKYSNSGEIIIKQKALLDCNKKVWFKLDGTGSCIVESSNDAVEKKSISIDEFINEEVTFIKMDLQGAELKALKGAEKTIREYRPKLAICVYHKPEDIIEIPRYIDSLNLGYTYYLRHHSNNMNETVFYAV